MELITVETIKTIVIKILMKMMIMKMKNIDF